MSVIRKLYEGEINFELSANPGTVEYQEASKTEEGLYETFYATLSPEQKVMFETFESARTEVLGMEHEERFRQGLTFGVKLMMELLG